MTTTQATVPIVPRSGEYATLPPHQDPGVFKRAADLTAATRNAIAIAVAMIGGILFAGQQYAAMSRKPDTEQVRAIVDDALGPMRASIDSHAKALAELQVISRSVSRSSQVQRFLVLQSSYLESVIVSVAENKPVPVKPAELTAAAQALILPQ